MKQVFNEVGVHLVWILVGIPEAFNEGFINPKPPTNEERRRSNEKRLSSAVGQKDRENSYLSSQLRQSLLNGDTKEQLLVQKDKQLDYYRKRVRSLEFQLQEAWAQLRRRRYH